jgi:hypothetical protein
LNSPSHDNGAACLLTGGGSAFPNHDLSGFDDNIHGIALLQAQLFGTAALDQAIDNEFAHSNDYTGHHFPEMDLLNVAGQLIAS